VKTVAFVGKNTAPIGKTIAPVGKTIAIVGNPNCGKTTLFNALTGMHQKVSNYPGVTVERKEGKLVLPTATIKLLDLPGLYSLIPHSPDEQIARDALVGEQAELPPIDAIINVVDASNLERNLYLTSQLRDLPYPVIIVLTMTDTARKRRLEIDPIALQNALGVPVFVVNAARREGISDLIAALGNLDALLVPPITRMHVSHELECEINDLALLIQQKHQRTERIAYAEAIHLLSLPEGERGESQRRRWSHTVQKQLTEAQSRLMQSNRDPLTEITEARYAEIGRAVAKAVRTQTDASGQIRTTFTERIDRVVLHRFWGYVIFAFIALLVFQGMFVWAETPKGWLESGLSWLKNSIEHHMAEGELRNLLTKGVLDGVGTTLLFLPQILFLLLFLALLEDTGYLARAAFLLDRLMSRVGLHGKSFIPLLSSYACAIPGIIATRTIDSPKARLLTMLIAPLMSCSARIPVYTTIIAAFIPDKMLIGFHISDHTIPLLGVRALVMFSLYALGTLMAFIVAAILNKTLLKGDAPTFLLEMPPYRRPSFRAILLHLREQIVAFLQRAGTVILALSIILWFLLGHGFAPNTPPEEQLERSYAGQMGHAIEPAIAPLGFDWKVGIGIIASFAAREIFVPTMAMVYHSDEATQKDEEKQQIFVGSQMREKSQMTTLKAIALLVFYVLAMQCISTVAVMRRETNGWKWPLFQVLYMTVLAWGMAFLIYQGGKLLGYE
jgi:ferrous iron transport protein B